MRKIHLVMPMGGGGTRFGNKGFQVPKPLIELQGKPFFYWATQSIAKFVEIEDLTFVVLAEHIERFAIDKKILSFYPDAKIQVIPEVLPGAVLTCRAGLKGLEDDLPILFNDCDHAFLSPEFYDFCKKAEFDGVDGALLTFHSDSPKFDENGEVTGTIEKVVVSNEAICGAYYVRNQQVFHDAVDAYLKTCAYKEFFMSGIYNEMVKQGKTIRTFGISEHISFGTPQEYDSAVLDQRLEMLI